MKNTKKTILIIFAVIFSIASTVFLPPKKASAYSEENLAWKKAIGIAIRDCYTKGVMKSPLTMEDYNFSGNTFSFSDEMTIIPNLNGNERAIKCYELFKRYIKDSDWPTTTIESKRDFFVNKLGYTETKNESSGECFRFGYDYEFDYESDWLGDSKEIKRLEDVATDYICAESIDKNGIINVDRMKIEDSNEERGKNKWAGSSFNVEWENHDGYIQADCWVQNVDWFQDRDKTKPVKFIKGETKWDEFKKELAETLRTTKACTATRHSLMKYTAYLRPNAIDIHKETSDNMFAEFNIEDPSKAATKAIKTIVGFSWSLNPRFSKTDTFSLYQAYAAEYYKSDIVCSTKEKPMTDEEKTVKKTQGYIPIAVFSNGSMQSDCFARATENSRSLSTGAEVDHYGEDRTFEEICAWLAKNHKGVNTSALEIVETKNQESNPDGKKDEAEPAKSEAELLQEGCFNNAGSFGWVICPAIFGLHNVSKGVYNTVEPLLQVHENVVDQLGRQDGEIFKAWSTFRNLANIVFAIIFLIIIFSQLTGYGIDNYGIKKTLPKLIITVILVNLSFIICAIAVDISNIVGSSIKGLFEGLGNNQLGGSVIGAQDHFWDKVLHYLALVAVAAPAGVVAIAVSGWALLIPILLFFLTAAISILFAFIILGLRQALIIILIVSAPIAIILSALPNTKTIYNKWFSLFKGVLMVYPIIGALVGVGYFTATIIYAGGSAKEGEASGFIMSIVAGLLSVVPYLMIPSVTRKSLDAVGSLGSKVSGFGDRLGKGAKSRINNTEVVKSAKANSAASMARFRAKKFMDSKKARKIENDIKNGNKVSVRRANKYARAAELANSDRNALLAARVAESKYNRLSSDTGFSAAMSSAADAEEGTEVKNYETLIRNSDFVDDNGKTVNFQNTSEIQTALEQELSRGGDKVDTAKIRALQNVLASKGDNGRNSIFKAMENAQNRGNVSSKAIKAFSSNIMNNQGDYKNQHRSLYEYAKTTAADGVNRDSSKHDGSSKIYKFATDGIQALTADSFLSADKTQIDAYRKAYQNNKLSTEDRTKLEQIAHSIANNPNVHSKIRTDDYGEALQAFAPDADWNAIYSGMKIDHPSDSTSSNGDTGNSENSNNSNNSNNSSSSNNSAGTNGNPDQGQSGGQTSPQDRSQDRTRLSPDEIANLNANIDAVRRAGRSNPEVEAALENIQQNGENRSPGGIILP